MKQTIRYRQCPSCGSDHISKTFSAKDFTVSQERFEVWECGSCTVRFTQDVPEMNSIGPYYQSSAYISHSDTDEGLVNRLYHIIRNYTLRSKRRLIRSSTQLRQGVLLDIGAGTGAFYHVMEQAGWQVAGIEPDETARNRAWDKYEIRLETPGHLDQLDAESFDAITMWHVLEHVHDLHGYLEKLHGLLKPGGKLLIAVPNYTSYDAEVYGEYWAAYDVPRHLYHFSPQSMGSLATAKGFTVQAFKPMWFDSFYVSMLSEQYKTGKKSMIRAFWNGLVSNIKAIGEYKKCSSVIYVLGKGL